MDHIQILNDDDKCLQNAATVVLSHEEIRRILKEYQKLNVLQKDIKGKA